MLRECQWRRRTVAGILLVACIAPLAEAATLWVDSTLDENSASAPNGSCTLREAILAANLSQAVDGCIAGDDQFETIRMPPGLFLLTIAGADEDDSETGDLDVPHSRLRIIGSGAFETIVDANGLDRRGFPPQSQHL